MKSVLFFWSEECLFVALRQSFQLNLLIHIHLAGSNFMQFIITQ